MRREQEKNRIDEQQREKMQKAPETDVQEDVSYMDKHASLKMGFYFFFFLYCCYKGHYFMTEKLNERLALKEGRALEYEQEKFERYKKTWAGKLFGRDETQAPIKTKIGGYWALQDLNRHPFGSESLHTHYYLLFFGSSLSPDVGPLTLGKMQKAQGILKRSSEGKQYI